MFEPKPQIESVIVSDEEGSPVYWYDSKTLELPQLICLNPEDGLNQDQYLPIALHEFNHSIIVNMSSSVVNVAPEGGIHYIASKAGVLGLTRGLARELGKEAITVNAIAPSVVETSGLEGTGIPQEALDAVIEQQSIKKMSQVKDLTGMIAFLCSEEAEMYTGQHVHLDGGIVFAD